MVGVFLLYLSIFRLGEVGRLSELLSFFIECDELKVRPRLHARLLLECWFQLHFEHFTKLWYLIQSVLCTNFEGRRIHLRCY